MSLKPDLDTMLDAAITSHEARDLDHAEHLYREILDIQADHPEALNLLGVILQDRGKVEELIARISRALEIDPEFADAHANLARGHSFRGELELAVNAARKATELDPSLGEGWLQLGRAQLDLMRDREALVALREASSHFPDQVEIYAGIGYATQRLEEYSESAEAWRIVLEMQPDRVDALVNLGVACGKLNLLDEALDLHRKALDLEPNDLVVLGALALTLHARQDAAELVRICKQLLAHAPDEQAQILAIMASGQMWLGQLGDATESCERALALEPDTIAARQLLGRLKPETLDDPDLSARFVARLNDLSMPVAERALAGFSAAMALDKAKDFDAAFKTYQIANNLYREEARAAGNAHNPEEFKIYYDWARKTFTPAKFIEFRETGTQSELPVFIVGLPRSGTSLVEQIAASHPRVFGAGELMDISHIIKRINKIPAYIPVEKWEHGQARREAEQHVARLTALGRGADRVIDKMPDNIKVLGQIRLLFPNARIIICHRDPRDVCISCFTTPFVDGLNWAWDVEDCARQAVDTKILSDFWRDVLPGPIMEINYETLVANMETESRRLIAFLGLDWDPACLAFHETEREVKTASALQVRKPIYTSAIGKWRRYEAHLGPMLKVLEEYPGDTPSPEAKALRLAIAARTSGSPARAIAMLRDAGSRFPATHDIQTELASVITDNGDLVEAIEAWRRALVLQPNRASSLAQLGALLTKAGKPVEAVDVLRRATTLQPDNPGIWRALATALWELKDADGTRDAYLRALAIIPEDETTLRQLGDFETLFGRFEEAAKYYRRILELNPSMVAARLGLLIVGKREAGELADFRSILTDPRKPKKERIMAGWALGKALDAAADYDGAFSAFEATNIMARDAAKAIAAGTEVTTAVDRLVEAFTEIVFQTTSGWGDPSELPVFVVGSLRSGTSLVEQILASHPSVFGAGELTHLFSAARALETSGPANCPARWDPAAIKREAATILARLSALGGTSVRVIDKLPGNIFSLGHIRMMLPRARIIVCRRDPRDIGLSCYTNFFEGGQEWSNDLGDIAIQIRETDRVIAHWRNVLPGPFMEIQYEDLVGNLEGESRRLIDFLGLDWDPACLEFHRTERAVATASVWQVRQKLYDHSIGRWRLYERHLGPLLDGLNGLVEHPARESQF